MADGAPYEVTSLRRDVDTDGRHATVAFGEDWTEDARRRDFTMNALYADAQGAVHDPLGGLPDLIAGRVRFIGDAAQRIREDYLRILRFFRFSANLASGEFDSEGVIASIRQREGLASLSRERIRTELLRILVARRADDAIRIMDESGILARVLGGVARRLRFERYAPSKQHSASPRPDFSPRGARGLYRRGCFTAYGKTAAFLSGGKRAYRACAANTHRIWRSRTPRT